MSNREQALDITQETFLRLWQNLQEEEILNIRAFLFTVARHLIIDWYRKKKSISLESLLMNDEEEIKYAILDEKTSNDLSFGAEGRYLIEKINELTPIDKEAVYLRFVEDLSPIEIGEILGISANAAGARVNRGLIELRKKTKYGNKENNKD
ncbi:RNA polymerase sigma factor [Candidatus Nomurabacteria bacterium]|nr:RNA polymerase sigma factor [Candidatus Nomurabacteria bacterium]